MISRRRKFGKGTRFPSGEKAMSLTGPLKLIWCSVAPRRKLAKTARPSVSRQRRRSAGRLKNGNGEILGA